MHPFDKWWNETGSGIVPLPNEDGEEHAKRVAVAAWGASCDALGDMLKEKMK